MFLFLSTCGILRIHSCSGNLCFKWFFVFIVLSSRHLHVALQLAQCYHQLGPDPCSEFSSELRAHCSAIIVSQLLRIVHNFCFCGSHFFCSNINLEDIVLDVDQDKLFTSVTKSPISSKCILMSLPLLLGTRITKPPSDAKRFLQHCTTLCAHQ